MNTSTLSTLSLAALLLVGMAACGDESETNEGGTGGSATGGTGGSATGGTGGSATGGTGGGAGVDCAAACANLASASCPDQESEAECVTGCSDAFAEYLATCGAEANAYVDCVAGAAVSCGADPDGVIIDGCDEEDSAYYVCIACVPETGDSACDTCEKDKCCAEMKAYSADTNDDTSEALFLCSETNCSTECADI